MPDAPLANTRCFCRRAAIVLSAFGAGLGGAALAAPPAGAPTVSVSSADAKASATVAGCARVPPVSGSDASARFRACFQGGELAYLEERPLTPPKAPPAQYFYSGAALAYYRTQSAPQATGGGANAEAATVPVYVEWLPDGELKRAVRVEHFGEVKLSADTVERIRSRGIALAALARAAHGTP